MQEGRGISYKREKLGFLYGRCSMTKSALGAWFEDDEFIERMWEVVRSDKVITDKVIYDIAKPMLDERSRNKESYAGFKFQNARKGLNQLRKAIGEE